MGERKSVQEREEAFRGRKTGVWCRPACVSVCVKERPSEAATSDSHKQEQAGKRNSRQAQDRQVLGEEGSLMQ